jgi:RNA polymerase sigma-70 factor (ECF subfamily)
MREKEKPNHDTDHETVLSCQMGDVEAFEDIVKKYQKKMFNVSFRMIGDYNEALDVVQEAFLSAYRGIKGFKGKSRFSTWLYTIVINLSKNRIKQLSARSFYERFSINDPVESGDGTINIEPPSGDLSALERLEKKERENNIHGCIQRLAGEFREVIVLRDLQGFSYDEIAGMLDIEEGTVKSRLYRAREALRECLKKMV